MARLPNQCIHCRYFFANQPKDLEAEMLERDMNCRKQEDIFAGRFCPSFKRKSDQEPDRK